MDTHEDESQKVEKACSFLHQPSSILHVDKPADINEQILDINEQKIIASSPGPCLCNLMQVMTVCMSCLCGDQSAQMVM